MIADKFLRIGETVVAIAQFPQANSGEVRVYGRVSRALQPLIIAFSVAVAFLFARPNTDQRQAVPQLIPWRALGRLGVLQS